MIAYEASETVGIAFAGERSELVAKCAEKLCERGLLAGVRELADAEFFAALNEFRRTEGLHRYEFMDPVTARELTGEALAGDELVLLASVAEASEREEIARLDFCRNALKSSRELGVTLTRYLTARVERIGLEPPSADTMRCAILADMLER